MMYIKHKLQNRDLFIIFLYKFKDARCFLQAAGITWNQSFNPNHIFPE